jgi:hypothetical protein
LQAGRSLCEKPLLEKKALTAAPIGNIGTLFVRNAVV